MFVCEAEQVDRRHQGGGDGVQPSPLGRGWSAFGQVAQEGRDLTGEVFWRFGRCEVGTARQRHLTRVREPLRRTQVVMVDEVVLAAEQEHRMVRQRLQVVGDVVAEHSPVRGRVIRSRRQIVLNITGRFPRILP